MHAQHMRLMYACVLYTRVHVYSGVVFCGPRRAVRGVGLLTP